MRKLVCYRYTFGHRSVSAAMPQMMRGRQRRQAMRAQAGLLSLHLWTPLGIGSNTANDAWAAGPPDSACAGWCSSLRHWAPLGIFPAQLSGQGRNTMRRAYVMTPPSVKQNRLTPHSKLHSPHSTLHPPLLLRHCGLFQDIHENVPGGEPLHPFRRHQRNLP